MKANHPVFIALIILVVFAIPTIIYAQSWPSGTTTGLTKVEWSLTGNTYTWTLFNNSGPNDGFEDFDIVIWSLQPFQVPEPVSWSAPEGWEWSANGNHQEFRLADSSRKYYTPSAVAPGTSVVFTYTLDPDAPLVNNKGPQPEGLAFLSHVRAVESDPENVEGGKKWVPASGVDSQDGWFDTAAVSYQQNPSVPEPSGALTLTVAAVSLAVWMKKTRRRLCVYRGSVTP